MKTEYAYFFIDMTPTNEADNDIRVANGPWIVEKCDGRQH